MALTLKRFLLNTLVVPGTFFGISSLPLALLGSDNVVISHQGERVFAGEIRHIASPYLAVTTVLSIGAGITNIAVKKWRQCSKKIAQMEEELSEAQKILNEKEKQLEDLKFSEHRLLASGLNNFLENGYFQSEEVSPKLDSEVCISDKSLNLSESPKITELQYTVEPEIQTQTIELNELHSQLQQIQTQLAWLYSNRDRVESFEQISGVTVFPTPEQLIKNESQFYRQKYEDLRDRVHKFSDFSNSATWELEVDIEVALKILSESLEDREEVEKVLTQSDRARQWKESLPEDIAEVRVSKYIYEVYTLAEELLNWRELHLLVPAGV